MSEFLTVEEAAKELGMNEALLRQWIRRGQARASRRGGDYQLRLVEVARLREAGGVSASLPLPLETPPAEPAAPKKLKVRPPRSERDPSSFSGEKDRRRRMGRRASDFTLEILHQEIVSGLNSVLGPFSHRLEQLEARLTDPPQADDQARLELERSQKLCQELQQQLARASSQSSEADLERERLLRVEAQQRVRALEDQLAGLRDQLQSQADSQLAIEAERTGWSYERMSLQGEVDRLTGLSEGWEAERQRLQSQLATYEHAARDAQTHGQTADLQRQEEESQREAELRRLREQVNSLTYRLQMAGPGSSGPSPEDSRRLMERLAEAEAAMAQKDQLIAQNYAEISELGSKLEANQRNYYELQQRYERLRDEWSQLAARQMTEFQQQQQLAVEPAPQPERSKGWGNLFRMRGD